MKTTPRRPQTTIELLEARIAPATFRWGSPGGGDWNNQSNWFNETTGMAANGFPNAVDDVAKFTNANTAGAIVNINGVNVTVGSILFDDSAIYQISAIGSGMLTFSSSGTATITVTKNFGDAAHVINAPVTLASSLSIDQEVSSSFTINTAISETAAGKTLTKLGDGKVSLLGNTANTFTGLTTIQAGTLALQKVVNVNGVGGNVAVGGFGRDATLSIANSSQLPDTAALTVNAQGTAAVNFSEIIGALTINDGLCTLGSLTLNFLTVSSLSMTGGQIQMNVANQIFNLAGDATVTSDATGPAMISGGTLNLGLATRTFFVNDGPQAQDLTISSAILGNTGSGLTKNNPGVLRLGGGVNNSYNGTTTVLAGTLELAKASGNSVNGPLVIGDGTGGAEADVVRLINGNQIANNVLVTVNSSGLLDVNGQLEFVGSLSVLGGHVTTGSTATTFTIQSGLTLQGGHLTAGAPGSVVSLPASITIANGAQSLLDGVGAFSLGAGFTSFSTADGPADVDLLVTAPITGSGELNKTGLGTLELDAANTHTGGTLVFGRLIVNGSVGDVTIGSSQATLAGTGTIGNLTLNAGAIKPGHSPGILHTGSISNGNGDTFYFEIDGAHPGNGPGFHDQLAVTGTVDLTNVNASFAVTTNYVSGDQYVLIDNDGNDPIVGTFNGLSEGAVMTIGSHRYILTYKGGTGNDVVLTPEQTYIINGDLVPGADDAFIVTRDANDPTLVHITDYVAYVAPVTYDVSLHQFANILILGGDGNDGVTFDATNGFITSAFPNVLDAVKFDGGTGANYAGLHGNIATPVDAVYLNYFGGPQFGEVSVTGGFRMSVDQVQFYNDDLPATDFYVYGNTGQAETLYVSAYGFFGITTGIAGHVPALVSHKTNVHLVGGGGGDTYQIGNLSVANQPTTIQIQAATDQAEAIEIIGGVGDETFTVATTSLTEGSITHAGQPMVSYTGTVKLSLDGGAGADTFNLPSTNLDVRITGGPGADTLSFGAGTAGIALHLDQPGQMQTLNAGTQLVLGDSLEHVVGTAQADSFYAKPAPLARMLDGGGGGDQFLFDAQGADAAKLGGTIATPGFGALVTTGVEAISLLNVPAKPALGAPGNTFATPLDFSSGKGATSVAVGDLNGDGLADFVTADSKGGTVSIALSTATGLLVPAVQKLSGGKKPTSVVLGDFDGVNGLDIAVTNSASGTIGILLNNGSGDFASVTTVKTGKTPGLLRVGNLDGDTDLDLAMITAGNKISILKNDGTGAFTASPAIPSGATVPKDLRLADLDGDGDLDLAVLHAGGQLAVQLNDGAANFSLQTLGRLGAGATALAIADFNGDGKLDVAATHASVSRFVAVALGQGTGAFLPMLKVAYPLPGKASALLASDFDGDGVTDLAVANGAGGRVSILRGLGNGAFTKALTLELEDTPARKLAALALGDFNGDGRTDLAALSGANGDVSVILRA